MSDLVFKNVSFKFEREFIFKNINFAYNLKDFLIVLGPNGAGKSTFLKLILGILRPNSGEILREFGTQIKNIGYVPQLISPNKSFPISVLEVVLMGRLDKKKLFFYSKADKIAALLLKEDKITHTIGKREIKMVKHKSIPMRREDKNRSVVSGKSV